jgi:dihydrofolate reductase
VLSTTLRSLPATELPSVKLHQDCSPAELAALAWRHDQRRLHVDGGRTIQGFLAAGLLAEITIIVIPVLLGEGRPLFTTLSTGDLWLTPLASRAFPFGFVQARWAIQASSCARA